MNSAPATLCSICGGRSPSSIAEPMKLAAKPIISTSGVTGSLSARASGSATGAIIRMTTTLSTNIEMTPASIDRIITSRPGPPARELQRLHRQPARHAGLSEVSGDDPDRQQDRHHVPVDQPEGVDLGHHADPHHRDHAEQRRGGPVDDVGDDGDDRDGEDRDCVPGQRFHPALPPNGAASTAAASRGGTTGGYFTSSTGTFGPVHDPQRRRAHQQLGERAAPVRAHDDLVALQLVGEPGDFLGGVADLVVDACTSARPRRAARRRPRGPSRFLPGGSRRSGRD